MSEARSLVFSRPVRAGERIFVGSEGCRDFPAACVADLCGLPVGAVLQSGGRDLLRILSVSWNPAGASAASGRVVLAEALEDIPAGNVSAEAVSRGPALAWITLSDKGAAGKRHDESGPLIAELVGEKLGLRYAQGFILPDDERQLRALLVDLALVQGFDLIMTTGGTGVAPRDVTPEATLAVIEKRLSGFERAMTAASLAKTPHGAVSRAVAGTLGGAIIVNMPGSPKAVRECLAPLLPTLGHTMDKLHGDPSDCATLRC